MGFWLHSAAIRAKEDPASAAPWISKVIQAHPNLPTIWYAALLAFVNQRCGDVAASQEAARQALRACSGSDTELAQKVTREMTALLQMSPGMSLKQRPITDAHLHFICRWAA